MNQNTYGNRRCEIAAGGLKRECTCLKEIASPNSKRERGKTTARTTRRASEGARERELRMRADSGVSSQMQNARAENPRTRYGNHHQGMGHDRRGCGQTKNKETSSLTGSGAEKPRTRDGT